MHKEFATILLTGVILWLLKDPVIAAFWLFFYIVAGVLAYVAKGSTGIPFGVATTVLVVTYLVFYGIGLSFGNLLVQVALSRMEILASILTVLFVSLFFEGVLSVLGFGD